MYKVDEVLDKVNVLLGKKEEEEKKCNTVLWVFAIIGAVAAVAAIAYAVYRYLTPDYLEDFEDDFEDDFDLCDLTVYSGMQLDLADFYELLSCLQFLLLLHHI